MTDRDNITAILREAYGVGPWWFPKTETEWLMLERFVALARAAEREACAQIADEAGPYTAADLIRARGKA